MPLIPKPNYNQIFASQAPEQDKPAVFNNYPEGWGPESRPNNGKPTIKGFNFLQQTSDLKDLWILQNGACLPYDESIEYAEGAPVLKDGVIQYKTADGFKSRDSVTIPTYNSAADGVDPVTGVQNGAYYNVRSLDDESYVDEYQNIGGVPTPTGKSYPSSAALEDVKVIADGSLQVVQDIQALRAYTTIAANQKVNVTQHSVVENEGGGNFQSFYSETALTDNDGTLIKSNVVPNLYWKRVDFQAVTPEMFGARASIDVDQAPIFNKMYLASELEGFICGSVKGRRYRIYTELDVAGANATYGFTEFRYRSNDARLRIRAKSRARFFNIETNSGFTGNAVYLNGLDAWGTEYQNNMFDDLVLRCPSATGTAIYLDCTQPNSRIAYAHSTNVRIESFLNGLYLHAAAPSGFSFINANTFTNYMSGGNNKNFIVMFADKSAGGENDVDSNKLVSFEFQNKANDNALRMIGCKLNQLIGQTYFDLTSADSVYIDETSQNNYIQGAWLQTYENIGSKNTVINQNNSTTHKSYQKNRTTFSTEYVQRERFILPPNVADPVSNEGSYFKTANTQTTIISRFRTVLEGKVISIYIDDTNTSFAESAYISLKAHGTPLRGVKGCIYNFVVINGVAVLEDNPTARTTDASQAIETGSGSLVYGPSNQNPIGRNSKWVRIMCDDGVLRMIPVWDVLT